MVPLISMLTQFLVVALVATAAVLGVAVGYFYVRARRAQDAEALSGSDREELQRRDAEIAAIRTRIEEMYYHQRHGSETQHAHVSQQIEELQRHLKARSRQIEGLQGQLRYEMQQREAAMQELRQQLAEGLRTLSHPALPAPASAALPGRTEPAPPTEPAAPPQTAEPSTPAPAEDGGSGWNWEPVELNFGLADGAAPPSSSLTTEPPPAQEEGLPDFLSIFALPAPGRPEPPAFGSIDDLLSSEPSSAPSSEEFEDLIQWTPLGEAEGEAAAYTFDDLLDDPFGDGAGIDGDPFASAPFGQDDFDPSVFDASLFEELSFFGGDGSGDGMAGDGAVGDGFSASMGLEGAEDLTVLPMITPECQAKLYAMGVLTIEDVARWSRADARRVAGVMEGVSEDVIMNEWVFAAQSVLFDRYQSELQARRAGAA